MMNTVAPADLDSLRHEITYHHTERIARFKALPLHMQGAVFEKLSPYVQHHIIEQMHSSELVALLDQFDLQQAENVLARIRDHKKRAALAHTLKATLNEKAEYFLRFHPKAELTLLSFNYLLLPHTATVSDAADAIDEHYREVGKLPEVLVHERGKLVGEVKPSVLVREGLRKKLAPFVTPVPSVHYTDELSHIIDTFTRTRHGMVIVLDTDESVVGIIYADDALRLFGSEPAASLYDFAGVSDTERALDGMWSKVRHRYKWLIINLGTCFFAASIVGLFEETINAYVLLAMYMPVVAGMGGNAATQTLAVMVRGISVGEISLSKSVRPILNEVGAGAVNGAINGAIVAVAATLFNQDPRLGLVVGAALVCNLVVAGFFGTLIPLIMKSLGKDPATSATIFITTATDVIGFFVFLGLATLVLL